MAMRRQDNEIHPKNEPVPYHVIDKLLGLEERYQRLVVYEIANNPLQTLDQIAGSREVYRGRWLGLTLRQLTDMKILEINEKGQFAVSSSWADVAEWLKKLYLEKERWKSEKSKKSEENEMESMMEILGLEEWLNPKGRVVCP